MFKVIINKTEYFIKIPERKEFTGFFCSCFYETKKCFCIHQYIVIKEINCTIKHLSNVFSNESLKILKLNKINFVKQKLSRRNEKEIKKLSEKLSLNELNETTINYEFKEKEMKIDKEKDDLNDDENKDDLKEKEMEIEKDNSNDDYDYEMIDDIKEKEMKMDKEKDNLNGACVIEITSEENEINNENCPDEKPSTIEDICIRYRKEIKYISNHTNYKNYQILKYLEIKDSFEQIIKNIRLYFDDKFILNFNDLKPIYNMGNGEFSSIFNFFVNFYFPSNNILLLPSTTTDFSKEIIKLDVRIEYIFILQYIKEEIHFITNIISLKKKRIFILDSYIRPFKLKNFYEIVNENNKYIGNSLYKEYKTFKVKNIQQQNTTDCFYFSNFFILELTKNFANKSLNDEEELNIIKNTVGVVKGINKKQIINNWKIFSIDLMNYFIKLSKEIYIKKYDKQESE